MSAETLPPPPAGVREYFDRRRQPPNPEKGFDAEERTFNDALWLAICRGASAPPEMTPLAKCPENGGGVGQDPGGPLADGALAIPARVTPKIAITPRACSTCGEPFIPWRPQAVFCSSACRQKAYRQRLAAAQASPRLL